MASKLREGGQKHSLVVKPNKPRQFLWDPGRFRNTGPEASLQAPCGWLDGSPEERKSLEKAMRKAPSVEWIWD